MNRPRIQTLIDGLRDGTYREHLPGGLDMGVVYTHASRCGCLIAYAVAEFGDDELKTRVLAPLWEIPTIPLREKVEAAAGLLGVDDIVTAHHLFLLGRTEYQAHADATPEQVAAVLEHFLVTGEVDWPITEELSESPVSP